MFQHSYRGTIVWLFIVGMALGLLLVAGDIPPAGAAILLTTYLALVLVIVRNTQVGAFLNSLPYPAARRLPITEVAREADARARSHPAYDPLISLLDIGLIVDEHRPDGLSLRRGRFISLDDDGMRPFAVIHVPEVLGGRTARIRFEVRNEVGQIQYVYEDDKWLEAGENAILPGYRLPIRNNPKGLEAGTWTVHFLVDAGMLGIHNFNLAPSLHDRRRQMSSDGEIRERVWRSDEEDASLPLSLEELLRQQSRQQQQG